MAKCDICGKGPQFGHNVSHSNVHTKRRWNPNIQKTKIFDGGQLRQVRICSKCLKRLSRV